MREHLEPLRCIFEYKEKSKGIKWKFTILFLVLIHLLKHQNVPRRECSILKKNLVNQKSEDTEQKSTRNNKVQQD